MNTKNIKQNWTDVKNNIKSFSHSGLLDLVKDLYEFSSANKSFLHSRFTSSLGEALERYEAKIRAPFEWKKHTPPSLKLSDAKKAISEYKKATGNQEGVLELKFIYLHNMIHAFDEFGISDDNYYDSLATALYDFLKEIKKLGSAEIYSRYDKRFKEFLTKYDNFGYGFEDDLGEAYEEFDNDWEELKK